MKFDFKHLLSFERRQQVFEDITSNTSISVKNSAVVIESF